MTNIDSILKSRDITFLTKVHLVKGLNVVNGEEVDFFFPLNSIAFSMIQWMLAI